jgi:flagellar biosynthetic protein FliR
MTLVFADWVESQFWLGFFVFLRVGGVVGLAPGFGEQFLPARIRLVTAVLLTVLVVPLTPEITLDTLGVSQLFSIFFIEMAIGLLLGIGVRAFVFALHIAGSIAAQATSLAQLAGSNVTEPAPAVGQVLVISGLALAMIMRLPEHLVVYLVKSYVIFPFGALPLTEGVVPWGIRGLASAFSLGFQLAAPFVAISLLYNLTLGVINRAMPQLMVVFIGAPAITASSLILLALLASVMTMVWWQAFEAYLMAPFPVQP